MSDVQTKSCSGCFRVLADDTRLRILKELQGEAVTVSEITKRAGVTQPTVSYHLQMLNKIGLIESEKRGRETLYKFNKEYPCRKCGVFSAQIKL